MLKRKKYLSFVLQWLEASSIIFPLGNKKKFYEDALVAPQVTSERKWEKGERKRDRERESDCVRVCERGRACFSEKECVSEREKEKKCELV